MTKAGAIVLTEDKFNRFSQDLVKANNDMLNGRLNVEQIDSLEKAKKDITKLVKKQVQVTRNGKTFMKTVYVKPGEAEAGEKGKKDSGSDISMEKRLSSRLLLMDALSRVNSKYTDPDRVTIDITPKGNYRVYYDGKDTGATMSSAVFPLAPGTFKKFSESSLNPKPGKTYVISLAGSKSNPHHVLEANDGSHQVDMMFDEADSAKKFADEKGFPLEDSSDSAAKKKEAKDYKAGDIIKFKDGEEWIVMKPSSVRRNEDRLKPDELYVKPYNKLAKDRNVSVGVDLSMSYINAHLANNGDEKSSESDDQSSFEDAVVDKLKDTGYTRDDIYAEIITKYPDIKYADAKDMALNIEDKLALV